jgi:hypothetical protein
VSGDDYVVLECPFRPVSGTFCCHCRQFVPLNAVRWADSDEKISDYRQRVYDSVPFWRRVYLAVFANAYEGAVNWGVEWKGDFDERDVRQAGRGTDSPGAAGASPRPPAAQRAHAGSAPATSDLSGADNLGAEPRPTRRTAPWSQPTIPDKRPVGPLVVGAILILVSLGVLFYNLKWARSVLAGPVPITLDELARVSDPATLPNQWVSFTFDQFGDTGLGIDTTRNGQTTARSRFLLIRVRDRWLIADVPHDHSGNRVVGYLETWWVPLRKQSMDAIKARFPKHAFLPYQIDAQYDQRTQGYSMLGIVGFFLVSGVVLVGTQLVRRPGTS